MKPLQVLCLSTWPAGTAPAVRFRCEAYRDSLGRSGIETILYSFFDKKSYLLYKSGGNYRKFFILARCFVKAYFMLTRVSRYDVIWLLREASPIGPPFIESIIRRVLRKPIVYEFDDAIWTSPDPETFGQKLIRCRSKVVTNILYSQHVIAGNEFLAEFAIKHNDKVSVIPTCVDTRGRFNRTVLHNKRERVVIGWTGSKSTNRYLKTMNPILSNLGKTLAFDVEIISDESPSDLGFSFRFLPWHPDAEIEDLLHFDIGIMPLADTEWEKGKCGFKLIQYMALGIPVVASDVGCNREIIRHGIDGYLCKSPIQWMDCLTALIECHDLRGRFGKNARSRIEEIYSVHVNVKKIADILIGVSPSRT